MLLEIGLDTAKEARKVTNADGTEEVQFTAVEGRRVLSVDAPDDVSTSELFTSVTAEGRGILAYHTDAKPLWVACPSRPALEALLAEQYGCATGKPADVEQTYWTANGPPGTDSSQPATTGA